MAVSSNPPIPVFNFQFPKGWLKAMQPENISRMSVTWLTFQSFNGWLKAAQPENILLMSVTLPTSQLFNGWLKAEHW